MPRTAWAQRGSPLAQPGRMMCACEQSYLASSCYASSRHHRSPHSRAPRRTRLTAAEQKDGFELLFDGKSLDKFIVPADQVKVWRVVNGVIRNEQAAPGATILTKEDFGNFVVRAEFRAHPGVNSALMLRQGRPQPAGYELQIRDKLLTDRTGGSYPDRQHRQRAERARRHQDHSRSVEHLRGDAQRRPHRRAVQRREGG